MRPEIQGIVETVLYVDDLEEACTFYEDVLGLPLMAAFDGMKVLKAGTAQNLLLFDRMAAELDKDLPGGHVPGHRCDGPGHIAFHVAISDFDQWIEALQARGVQITSRVTWPAGGRSLYFDDPADNVIELATPGLWPNF
ncbi:VOC family protein [Amorphus orientalis]|uniref:Catechol 2,3-dioxygenase-like lactoylglutathione lyase family enzyme n=1 Tax=Amorphus orientalis TaxID=649198 RepID=A0AAE4ATS1_9HYPH|nr:VOC family protein [Amorphus orientalis]MDQ0316500.1 catechol 2,3-dioxygenase-like lactoylglutathione lyase family enzyme [Amorphus orientalis]